MNARIHAATLAFALAGTATLASAASASTPDELAPLFRAQLAEAHKSIHMEIRADLERSGRNFFTSLEREAYERSDLAEPGLAAR